MLSCSKRSRNSAKTHPPSSMARSARGLSIVSWNSDGIYPKRFEFNHFVNHHDPDVICIQETMLRPCTFFALANYDIIRNDRADRPGGGTAIFVRKSIRYRVIDLPPLQLVEATAGEIIIERESLHIYCRS